jgi:hypothetical protein
LVHFTICSLRIRWSEGITPSIPKTIAMSATRYRKRFDSISYGNGMIARKIRRGAGAENFTFAPLDPGSRLRFHPFEIGDHLFDLL